MSQPPEVSDVPASHRYEARFGETLAGFAEYLRAPGAIAFTHTEVDPRFEGRGVAGALARASLDEARAAGATVVASCPFYAGWIERHPEYRGLLGSAEAQAEAQAAD
ncbi:GNAT family N-acetyltransferase [Streptacidiphilus sp. PB12-B1b]|uniref:GNAT family N-acetyltransferase n=1 Tax=Streptacidiphilus sp. PB12-B1b TaxID=2705012 RepID=UPI001CDD4CB4|nr:GNAT family N-acetyltransferase [Streptacidiphilus sp. PB12-B1b]